VKGLKERKGMIGGEESHCRSGLRSRSVGAARRKRCSADGHGSEQRFRYAYNLSLGGPT